MSVSTNALIAYGINFDPEESEDERVFEFFEGDDENWYSFSEKAEKWRPPIKIEMHCSSSYTMYVVAAADTVMLASRGSPVEIPTTIFQRKDYAKIEVNLRRFCKEANLPYSEPRWLLFSYWDGP